MLFDEYYIIYYEQAKNSIRNTINLKYQYDLKFNDSDNKIYVYLNGNLVLKGEYFIAGMYNICSSTWYWGWNIDFINKDYVKPNKKNINILDNIQITNLLKQQMYFYLSNGSFYLSNSNIRQLIKLVLYITKSIWYFPVRLNNDNIQYIFITKIVQYG